MWNWMNTGSSGIGESSRGDIVFICAAKICFPPITGCKDLGV
jgi:hypothetical protein